MEYFFLVLLVVMLLLFGYAQLQKDVFRLPGKLTSDDEDVEPWQ